LYDILAIPKSRVGSMTVEEWLSELSGKFTRSPILDTDTAHETERYIKRFKSNI
jgi:hypothetical protein